MKTSEILKTEQTIYYSKESAKESVKFITSVAGIKRIECDTPKDYTTFITLERNILISSGCTLYAIWISNTYDKNNRLIWKVSLQTEETLSMRIGEFINKSVEAGELILTESMIKKVSEAA